MATESKPGLPNEFYTASTFFTLSGIAGAVWLFCLVLSNFESVDAYLDAEMYRLIALTLSLILAIMMLLRQKIKKKMEHWLFAFFNALLIFINASGLNAIQNNLSFVDEVTVQESSIFPLAMIPFFKNNVSWWPDKTLVTENKNLKVENDILKQKITQIKNKIDSTESKSEIISQDNEQLADSLNKQFATLEETTNAYSNLINRFRNASEALTACQTDLEVLNDKINDITTLYEAEKDRNTELNEKYSIQTDELDAAREELANCQLKIESLSKEAKRFLELYKSEQDKNKKLTKEIEALRKSITDKTNEFKRLDRSYKILKKSYAILKRERDQLKAKLKECEGKLPKPTQID